MQITVTTRTGNSTITLNAESSESIVGIKAKTRSLILPSSGNSLRIIFEEQELLDGKIVADYDIHEDSVLIMEYYKHPNLPSADEPIKREVNYGKMTVCSLNLAFLFCLLLIATVGVH